MIANVILETARSMTHEKTLRWKEKQPREIQVLEGAKILVPVVMSL